jgi:hypothetical protein
LGHLAIKGIFTLLCFQLFSDIKILVCDGEREYKNGELWQAFYLFHEGLRARLSARPPGKIY